MSQLFWRLLITGSADGAYNMAVDQAVMEAVAAGHEPPTLRFYAWQPPCLSLGYTQPIDDVDRGRLRGAGWDVVRRLTGGRAILHTDELTYSVALQASDPIAAGDIIASYRNLSRALLAGLVRLGAQPHADRRTSDAPQGSKGPVCFEVPSHYEITVNEKKLVGSAQVRKFGAILQHGSLPLHGDIARICDALIFEDETQRAQAKARVRQRAATLEDGLGRIVPWDDAVNAMIAGFREIFNLQLEAGTLSAQEASRAEKLRAEQYATEAWNARF